MLLFDARGCNVCRASTIATTYLLISKPHRRVQGYEASPRQSHEVPTFEHQFRSTDNRKFDTFEME